MTDISDVPTIEVLSKRVTRTMEAMAESEAVHGEVLRQMRKDISDLAKIAAEHSKDLTWLYNQVRRLL